MLNIPILKGNPLVKLRKRVMGGKKRPKKQSRIDRTHAKFNATARQILAGLDAEIPAPTRRLCDAYAQDVLGGAHFAPWLYVYSMVAGEFRDWWIPENYYWQYYVERLTYRTMGRARGLNRFFFEDDCLPDLGYIVDGRLIMRDGQFIPAQKAAAVLFDGRDKIIFKADNSRQGTGVQFFTPATFDANLPKTIGNGVFQRIIAQHPAFDPISERSLATLRLTTAHNENGEFSLRGCFIHSGRSDDTFVQAKTALRIAFDPETGRISDRGYFTNWKAFSHHPDTQARIADLELPGFQACKNLALRLHQQMPYVQCIGWDMAVDPSGRPHLLEWNTGHTDVKFMEATQGPCYADLGWQNRWREKSG